MVIEEYKNEIGETIRMLKTLRNLAISSINIYGSATCEKIFSKGYSDIDMIIMSDKFDKLNLKLIVDEISKINADFKEKKPMIVDDFLCKRIEFYLKYKKIAIDVTISPGLIPTYQSLEKNAWYDNFEAIAGGVYENSKNIYGKIPDYDKFKNEFFPFYNDDLREKRLDILANRILSTNELIKKYIEEKDLNITDCIYKIRKHFIQFMFIYYRKYFLSPEKHIYYQLTNILDLSKEEKNIICFSEENIFSVAKKYVELSNHYINNYYNEKRVLIKKKGKI